MANSNATSTQSLFTMIHLSNSTVTPDLEKSLLIKGFNRAVPQFSSSREVLPAQSDRTSPLSELSAAELDHHDHDHEHHDHDQHSHDYPDHNHDHNSLDFSSDGTTTEEDFSLQNSNFRWQQPGGKGSPITITYSYGNLLNGGIQGGITKAEIKTAIEESFKLWAQYAPLDFVEVPDSGVKSRNNPNAADIRIGHENLGGRGGTLGRANLQYYGDLATTVNFDNQDRWGTDRTSTQSDFLGVAVHEIGHVLGLRHESSANAVMQPTAKDIYSGLGSAFLYADDINGIRALYGRGKGSLKTLTSSTPAPAPTPDPAPSPSPSPNDSFIGTQQNDTLRGDNRSQVLRGLAGNDRIFAGAGDDRAYGDDGNDRIFAEDGNDRIFGGNGNDRIFAGAGNDRAYGGNDNDRIFAGAGNDQVYGGLGQDEMHGEAGNDTLLGTTAQTAGRGEQDTFYGGAGADRFIVGDRTKAFYDDGKAGTSGTKDFASILDFNVAQGDTLQLHGQASDYRLGSISTRSGNAVGIYLQEQGRDELIATLKGNSDFSLQSSAVRFVS